MKELSKLLEKLAQRVDTDFSRGDVTRRKSAEKMIRPWYVSTTAISVMLLTPHCRTQQRLILCSDEAVKMLRQLEHRVEEVDLDHREVVRPALQIMICIISKIEASTCSDTPEKQQKQQTLTDGKEATKTLLKVWNSKLCVRNYLMKVSMM